MTGTGDRQTEACGRCGVTTVLDAAEATDGDEHAEAGSGGSDAFAGGRIEVDERALASVVRHEVALGRLRDRLDAIATRLTYGR